MANTNDECSMANIIEDSPCVIEAGPSLPVALKRRGAFVISYLTLVICHRFHAGKAEWPMFNGEYPMTNVQSGRLAIESCWA